jgi:thiamine-phosphate pyrophosphorylase
MARALKIPNPPLLVISDRSQARRPLEEIAEAAFAAGCRWFSLREKDLPPAQRRDLLAALVMVGDRYGATVTVHDDVDAALSSAAGVHLPSGASLASARSRLPIGLIGASAHSASEAQTLLREGADYVTISPVFMTASKPGYGPALGLVGLTEVVAQASGAVVALGGVTAENAAQCRSAGAQGIAVMGEIMRASDPQAATEAILLALSGSGRIRHTRH